MKTLKELLTESLVTEANFDLRNFELGATWDLIDMMNDENDFSSFDSSEFDNYSISVDDSDLEAVKSLFSWFGGLIKKSYIADVEDTFEEDYDPYEFFDLKRSDHGLILHGEGDGERYSIFLFNKKLAGADKKKLEEMLKCYENEGSVNIMKIF